MKNLVIKTDPKNREWWKKTILNFLPDYNVYLWDEDEYEYDCIDVAVVWSPPKGVLAKFKNLKLVVSIGAGVSHILCDKMYPKHVPIIRTISENLRRRMLEYILLHVLSFHRKIYDIIDNHHNREWCQKIEKTSDNIVIGVMGVGNFGAYFSEYLSKIGYRVIGWSKDKKNYDFLETSYFQKSKFIDFLKKPDILINTLPQTPETENLLDKKAFSVMKKESYFINVGRGEVLVDADLVDAINNGIISRATLDVFRDEPLSKNHILYNHPKILVTCHTASSLEPDTSGKIICKNIADFFSGKIIKDMIDMRKGY